MDQLNDIEKELILFSKTYISLLLFEQTINYIQGQLSKSADIAWLKPYRDALLKSRDALQKLSGQTISARINIAEGVLTSTAHLQTRLLKEIEINKGINIPNDILIYINDIEKNNKKPFGNVTQANSILANNFERSFKANTLANLEPNQWQETVKFFYNRCAYCQEQPFETMDHFIPLALGGGTTWYNCVPACTLCNQKKGCTHPLYVTNIPGRDIMRVAAYLCTKIADPKHRNLQYLFTVK